MKKTNRGKRQHESVELNQSLLESSTDCIKFLDLDAHLLFMNGGGCKTLEIDDFSQVANAYWLDFWKDTDAAAARAAFETAKTGGVGHFQGYCPTWKGTPKWWDVVITPIFGAQGKPERLLAISRDITEARQAEDQLRMTLESLGDGCVAFDAEWRFLYVNQPAERLSRKRREELLGRTIWEVFPLTVGTNLEREFRRVAAGEPRDFENFFEPWGRWFQNRCYPRAGGGISVYFQDITERKRSEDDLRGALQQLQVITENLPTGVVRCSRDHRYVWVSHSYATWMGRPPEAICGRSIPDVLGDEYYQTIRPHIERVLSGERVEYEAPVNSHEGAQLWIHAVYVPTRGLDQEVDGWIAVVSDVTDRHEAEQRLRESEERLRRVLDNADVGLTRCSRDWFYVSANPAYARIAGKPLDQIVGRPIAEVMGAGAAETIRPHVERVLLGQHVNYDAEVPFEGTGQRYLHVNYTPDIDAAGQVVGWVACVTDITELNRAERALHEREQESFVRQKLESIGTLARGIAHDFNNLLGGVLAQAELGLAECAAGSYPNEELRGIRNVAIRGSEIVRQLMIYAGKETETLELVDVTRIVAEMIELLKVSVSKHAMLETDFVYDLPAVRGNAAQIRQIVMNLVMNASEAIGDQEGVVRIKTRRVRIDQESSGAISYDLAEGDYIQLEVSDTGCGMSQEMQTQVFDPFFTTKSEGHGLGLAVVQGVARVLRGSIQLTSEPGKGTTFQVLLPCAIDTAAGVTDGPMSDVGGSARPLQQITVLIVEDETPLRQAVAKMLRNKGFIVLEAADGSAAIDLLRANEGKFNVILLDATIPRASSYEVVAEATQARPDIRVILTSAYSRDMLTPALNVSQVCGFIRKPFQLNDLVQQLQNAVASTGEVH